MNLLNGSSFYFPSTAQAPYVLRNEVLHISKGEQAAITTQLLDIRDDDNPQDVVVNVLDPPRHGQLLQTSPAPAASVYQFHLDELSRGLLLYAHDGSDSTSDIIVFQANDGHSFQNILFRVKNVPKVGVIPRVTVFLCLSVKVYSWNYFGNARNVRCDEVPIHLSQQSILYTRSV